MQTFIMAIWKSIPHSDHKDDLLKNLIYNLAPKRLLTPLIISLPLLIANINVLYASGNRIYQCATSKDVYKALDTVKPGDTIMLQGGKVYEIDKSFKLYANGSDRSRITLTSKDSTDLGRYAVISTVGQKKEEDLVALRLSGSFWNISRIEITGKKVSLDKDYWNTHGFRIGLYLLGSRSHHNLIEDVHIHHTHNAAVAIRDESHHNTFRRMKIHHIGEWLDKDYDAHEGEGFYIGSSKGLKEGEKKARVHNIIIEESILGPGLLGQYIDIKYAASFVTARNNILYCYEKSYNEEVIKLAGFANVIKDNKFIGSNKNLTQYIRILNKKTDDPIKVDYLDQKNIPAPTGRDNTVVNNVFYTNDPKILVVEIDVAPIDRSSVIVENNKIEPFDDYEW